VPCGRSLGLDVGEKRIGVALSDEEGWLAAPLEVILRREAARDFARIAGLVQQHGAARVVVGLPRTLAGEIGPQAQRVQRWAARLEPHLPVPLVYWDERYSTAEAARLLAVTPARHRPGIDAAAAAVILQDFLDAAR
jgi:putative Holliday junction resolvase